MGGSDPPFGRFVIVASGPSAAREDIAAIRDRAFVIAVNESWKLCPWADGLYGDGPWWQRRGGLPEFGGRKWTSSAEVAKTFGIKHVPCLPGCDRLVTGNGSVGDCGNSGFRAVNLAVNLGARLIALVGFDMRLDGGKHWHGEHPSGLRNPEIGNVVRWRRLLDEAAADFARLGVRVVNCSPVSALTAYPVLRLAEALA